MSLLKRNEIITRILVILASVLAGTLLFFIIRQVKVNSSAVGPVYHEDGTITLPENAVSYGVRDPKTKEIIDQDQVLKPINEKITVVLDLEQNMSTDKEYILFVMINNFQHSFMLDNIIRDSYTFTLAPQGGCYLNVEIDTNKDQDKDIMFLFFENPSYRNIVENDIYYTTQCYTGRIPAR